MNRLEVFVCLLIVAAVIGTTLKVLSELPTKREIQTMIQGVRR